VLGVDEDTLWAANGNNAGTTPRLLKGLDLLMTGTKYNLTLLDGKNFGLQRSENPECSSERYAGLADYGDKFAPNTEKNYVASIEIPMDVLCGDAGTPCKSCIN
jgi:hypothetical protein